MGQVGCGGRVSLDVGKQYGLVWRCVNGAGSVTQVFPSDRNDRILKYSILRSKSITVHTAVHVAQYTAK